MKVVIAILAGIGAIAIALCLAVGFTWYSDQVKSRMPNCGDVISTVEELSRESGKKKIVNASDQTLAITYINGALAQVGQQILNGECNPRNGQPCPGNGPFQSQDSRGDIEEAQRKAQEAQKRAGTGIAPPNQPNCFDRNGGPTSPSVQPDPKLCSGKSIDTEVKEAKQRREAEQAADLQKRAELRAKFNHALESRQYTFNGARLDGEDVNKKVCSVNLTITGQTVFGAPTITHNVERYSIQMSDDGRPWITLGRVLIKPCPLQPAPIGTGG